VEGKIINFLKWPIKYYQPVAFIYSHDELLAMKGIYANMWNNQVNNENEGATVTDQ